jgi:hypothetical protein
VLKDGQVIEQGNHKQLLKLNGVFAAMWADQINAAGGLSETVSGYRIDDAIPFTDEPVTGDIDAAPTQDTAEPLAEASEAPVGETAPAQDTVLGGTRPQGALLSDGSAAVAVAGTQVDDTPASGGLPTSDSALSKASPVAFPTSDSAPVAFPGSTSGEAASQKASSVTQAPGITFAKEVGTPERTGTPDPESETKRKRISSQNFQRLARRISLTTRRGSGSGIPILGNLRRDASTSASSSTPAQAQASTDSDAPKASSESPAGSIQSEPDKDKDKDKAKKEKDKKKRRTFI